jgi:uroporphyrinogen III methyltransferase/synthase
VSLVGAGPGDPGLLTLRAAECLARADVIVFDRHVPARLLEHARSGARLIRVHDLPGKRHDVPRTLAEAARQGLRAVRLIAGDPFADGPGAREARALHKAGVAYEVVPGVARALAAAAFAGIAVARGPGGGAVALVNDRPGQSAGSPDWEELAHFPGTLFFSARAGRLSPIARALLAHGLPADTPAAVARAGGTNRQRTAVSSLGPLAAAPARGRPGAAAVLFVGPAVRLRGGLAWFERRPLFGRRVLVTRPRGQAGDMVRRLEWLGAIVSVLPAVEIREPPDWGPVDRALAELGRFGWVVFTSANGVRAFLDRLRQTGRDLRALGSARLAAIGPATAAALRGYHLEADVVPARYRSEGLAEELKRRAAGARVLLARADRGRDVLREELAAVAEVHQVAVYSQVDAPAMDPGPLRALREGRVNFVTLTSSNIARALVRALDGEAVARVRSGAVGLVTISSVTSAAVRELSLPVAAEAKEETVAGVVAALVELARGGHA